jgi:hypothetical protein
MYYRTVRECYFPWVGEFSGAFEEAFTREGLDAQTVMPLSLWQTQASHASRNSWSDYTLSLRTSYVKQFTPAQVTDTEGRTPFFTVVDDGNRPYTADVGLPLPLREKQHTSKAVCT